MSKIWVFTLMMTVAASLGTVSVTVAGPLGEQERGTASDLLGAQGDWAYTVAQARSQDSTPRSVSFAEDAPRRWWPVLMSLAVPGLGEVATGHKRGYFLLAADAGSIYSAVDKNNEGNDIEVEFEAFADQHWDEDEWRIALSDGLLEPYFPDLGTGSTAQDVPLWVTREEDEREYYENLGKWDQFAWGWREYWEAGFDPGDPSNPNFITPLRQEYLNLRGKSNDAFNRRDLFLSASLLLRVFSVLEMAYLEGFIGNRFGSNSASYEDAPQVSMYVSPLVQRETKVGLKVTY